MSYQTIELDQQGPVAIVSLNRPKKLNAINSDMLREVGEAMDEIEGNDAVFSLVLHGRGRAFCSGFDLQAGAKRETRADWKAAIDADLEMIMRFWHCPKPTIAAVHGYALAGGFELALACDMTVCDNTALFGEPEMRFGSSIVALLLPWYVNPKRAKKMLLTGQDRMTADEALKYGIVNEVVGEEQSLERALAIAREVAMMDPDSIRQTKQAINNTYDIMGLTQALRMSANTSIDIESNETDLRRQFNQILRTKGMQEALSWREARLSGND